MLKTITLFRKAAPLFFFLFLAGISSKSYAQCAGEDASTTFCNKETSQFIDLFATLSGSPVTSGTWSDDNNSGGLNATTGELNTWLINRGGTFNYTYTVEGITGCTDNQATVTVTLAGYAGRNNNDGVACETETNVNLFQFVGSSPSPTLFGTWAITAGPTNALKNQIFNAQQAGPGLYTFTYTVAAQGSCLSTMSTVRVEVIEAPDSGSIDNTVNTVFCETDDLSGFTAFNLRDAIIGEDNGGVWTENQTNEINGFNDNTIDIQNIRDTFGPGTYTFTYTVQPVNPICTFSQTTVAIIIEEVVDFTNAALELTIPDDEDDIICEDTLPINATATITGDIVDIPNGDYELTYSVTPAPNTGTETVTLTMADGIGNFNIKPDFLTAAGVAEIRVVSILDPNTQNACDVKLGDLSDTITIVALPDVNDSALSVNQPLCFGKNGTLTISDAGNTPEIELTDGEYSFSYTLASSTATGDYSQTAMVTNGIAKITLAANALATADAYTITLNTITNSTGCSTSTDINTTFTVSPKPDAETVTVSVQDTCEDDTVTVTLTDSADTPNLVDGDYTLRYDISGAINTKNQIIVGVAVTNGTGSFDLPQAILANGSSILTLTSILNNASTCEADNLTMPSAAFNIVATPDATGAVIRADDSCEDAANNVTITTDPTLIQDGDYILTYNLNDANATTDTEVEVTFTDGKTTFDLTAAQLAEAGTTTITIISLATASQSCAATGLPISTGFEVSPIPSLENTTLSVASVCVGEPTELLFTNSDLSDGSYDITYELTGENTLLDNVNLEFTDGEASLPIAAATITNTGSTSITINSITDPNSTCANTTATSTSFEVNPVPELTDGDLLASDICLAENGFVTITAGANLVDGDYTITYDLSETNTASNLSADVTIANGAGAFEIPAAFLAATGTTTITATLISSDAGCDSIPISVNADFEVSPVPNATGITGSASDVCFGEQIIISLSGATSLPDADYLISYQLSGATDSEIITETAAFAGGSTDLILESSVFTSGGLTTFSLLDIQNSTTGCSATNLPVTLVDFTLEDPAIPSLASDGAVFCINDDPTVADLEANISSSFTLITYDSATGTTLVSPSTPLMANTTYYIAAQNTATGCEGSQRLEVTVDLSGCDSVFIPDGFSPNGDGINDVFEMKNMDIVYPDYKIEIFNRYGQVVFKGDSSTGFWNGHTNQNRTGGNTLPNGVYFYIINYNDGQTSPKQGKVYLNR
ncbi:gliding motility-associated C-terminal domain-containing protein [Leeuwenhoekiella marinoflava]|uniref:Gliding motility-associated-like protein n=2 Tax=Leeuwenhoekiella marinoflava TaxID=988 RepID=A0A4Q0PM90_9FLAO|nr:gliding motility-associated C-terminal domain-containing protein [Leeuwenhoekiella marinoflava]RXG30850.1 gliding motility-associated-like protein [Leeuwenhoekiella marinoflava]SHF14446.1 gliding motility-associated C-terminal domain-containing protein [Leeuwenhoekiella marinoflava DSM 3653]